jgi:hypothetical protein
MLRSVATIKVPGQLGDVTVAVQFDQMGIPETIQPMSAMSKNIGNEFPFDHTMTEGESLQELANKAALLIIYADPMPEIDSFDLVLVAAE